ncbi:hypothetical protein EZS27_016621 [termite gut metagenome]|uniref:DUF4293 family protein n=1 Tax=termite gut metagenome TaxID=433724 RepID=A0A5J4RMM2_9ZZZZ
MIQRIQSLYLLLITGLLIASIYMPLGYFYSESGGEAYTFSTWGLDTENHFYSTWGLLIIISLCAGIAFTTIFLFKKRMLQIRMAIFNSVLTIGYYLAIMAFYFTLRNKPELGLFRISWTLCFPAIAVILNFFVIRAIWHDEIMVKAATNRLR